MGSNARWTVGAFVVMAAFALVTWLCGALILVHAIRDPGIRWGVAAVAGGALAGFLALWGQSFATKELHADPTGHDDLGKAGRDKTAGSAAGAAAGTGDVSPVFNGGNFYDQVIVARDISDRAAVRPTPPRPDQA
jgi:hypothetical protein